MTPSPLPRLLIVSATYVARENRKKLAALAAHFEVTAVTCRRNRSRLGLEERADDGNGPDEGDNPGGAYRLIGLPALGRPATTTKYLLVGLGRVMRREGPFDVVLVEAEPWALVRWQTWFWTRCWQRRARFGEFTWENIERPGWRGRVLRVIYRWALAGDAFAIAGSREAGEILRRRGLDPERLLVSPQLGVDAERFRPVRDRAERDARRAEFARAGGGFLVGFAGRLEPEKGLLELVSAVRAVRTALPELNVGLCLLGAGSLGGELRRVAASEPWLSLHAPRSHGAMAEFMQALDLFVLPSREVITGGTVWREQFGHVLIEAMACGTPALGSDSGAIPEVVGEPELIFPGREPRALTDRLTALLANPARLAVLGEAQRERTRRCYTNAVLARTWAEFLYAQRAKPVSRRPPHAPPDQSTGLLLGDSRVLNRENRPRRFLDQFSALDDGVLEECYGLTAPDDEALEHRLRWLKHQRLRVLFNYCLGPCNTLLHLPAIRRASFLYVEGPHYFWLLLLLHQVGLLPMGSKVVCCLFYRQERFRRKLTLFNRAPAGFRPFFISAGQINALEAAGCRPGRLRLVKWRIDADWYRPASAPTRDYLLCAGNIHRDEQLVVALLDAGLPLRLVRAGRLVGLRETYAPAARRWPGAVELAVNLDHRAYLRLVQNAALVLLPICPCDEPAGLTAALEALACGTPLLANDSLEVGALLRAASASPPLPDLHPTTWRRAIAEALAPGGRDEASLAAARAYIEREHAIRPDNRDWREFAAKATI